MLVDGSVQDIHRDTFVRWDVDCRDIDPQELQSMEEKAVQNLVERIGESIVWGPDQEVSLLRFDNWKGCYVRIEDGEDMVAQIDRQEGWTSKVATFYAELIDLKSDSKVGYVQSKMASQMADAEWVAQMQMLLPISELTVIGEERRDDDDEEDGHNGAGTIVSIDWNDVDLEERTYLVIAPIADIKMAILFGIPVDDRDKEKDDTSVPAGANPRNSNPQDDADILEHVMEMGADDVDDADDNELVNFEPVLELLVQSEPVLELAVQSEIVAEVEEVHQVKHAEVLGRVVGRPTGHGKKTRSIYKLSAVEVDNSKKSSVTMEFVGVTLNLLPVVPERRFPDGVIEEDTLRVWAISRWRGPVELTRDFLNLDYAHLNLPPGTRPMFRLNIDPDDGGIPLVMLTVTFRNGCDTHALLG
ncbi:Auxin-induced protein 5NG4 [Hordeum vulgare]|nr:Auxin-induced protein 5NG4 [Hordeum vulgare]